MTSTSTHQGAPAIELTGLRKDFGTVHAVRGIDLRIEPGEIVAFLGPNGAGKTTTIDMVLGLLDPDRRLRRGLRHGPARRGRPRAGRRRHADRRPAQGPHRPRDRRATPAALFAHTSRVEAVMRRAGITEIGDRRVDKCSGGAAAAAALRDGAAHRPRAAGPRRADDGHGRRGPPRVLAAHPRRRRPGPHRPVRDALPRGGRRLRRPDRPRAQGRRRRRRHGREIKALAAGRTVRATLPGATRRCSPTCPPSTTSRSAATRSSSTAGTPTPSPATCSPPPTPATSRSPRAGSRTPSSPSPPTTRTTRPAPTPVPASPDHREPRMTTVSSDLTATPAAPSPDSAGSTSPCCGIELRRVLRNRRARSSSRSSCRSCFFLLFGTRGRTTATRAPATATSRRT